MGLARQDMRSLIMRIKNITGQNMKDIKSKPTGPPVGVKLGLIAEEARKNEE